MEQQKVDMFIGLNNENFNPQHLVTIKQKMEHPGSQSRPTLKSFL
jgi:hypothetical protein